MQIHTVTFIHYQLIITRSTYIDFDEWEAILSSFIKGLKRDSNSRKDLAIRPLRAP